MKKAFTILLNIIFCFLIFSCNPENKIETPQNVLNEDQYVHLLIQEHIIEGAINIKIKNTDSALATYNQEHLKLLNKEKIEPVNYDSTVAFYGRNPLLLQKVYTRVTDSLSVLEGKTK